MYAIYLSHTRTTTPSKENKENKDFKDFKDFKGPAGGNIEYRAVCVFISRYALHLFELFAICHRSARIIPSRRACNGTEVFIFSVRSVIFLIS